MAIFVSGTMAQLTSGRSNLRRVIVTSKSAVPSRPMVTTTCSPSGPRTRETVSSTVSPSVLLPLTAWIWSPRLRPASSAGVPGKTVPIVMLLASSSLTWTPMPTNEPDSDWSAALASSAVMNDVWPSSPTASVRPRMAP